MSVRSDAAGNYGLYRTTSLPDPASFTMCGWARRRASQTGVYRYLLNLEDYSSYWMNLGWATDDAFGCGVSGIGYVFTANPSVDSWFFWTMRAISGGSYRNARAGIYYNGAWEWGDTSTGDVNFTAADGMRLLYNAWGEPLNGEVAFVKVWDAILTDDEVKQEAFAARPVRMANLHLFSPLWSTGDIKDYSGNARDWTSTGSLTDGEPPPTGYGMTQSGLYVPVAAKSLYAQLDEAVRDSNDYVYL